MDDIYSAIGKLPAPGKGWTLLGHNYSSPYNPFEQQLKYDPETGEFWKYTNNLLAIVMQWLCNTMWISAVALTENKNTVKRKKKNASMPMTVEW